MPSSQNPNTVNLPFATGAVSLPDVGTLRYNGATFSSLFKTEVSGRAIKDNARRTTKCTEFQIMAEGFVTLDADADVTSTTDDTLEDLRAALMQDGGRLTYTGKGLGSDLDVNAPNGKVKDVEWGPKPELLEFKPLGASRSALIKWRVTTRVFDFAKSTDIIISPKGGPPAPPGPVLQFNEETGVSYDADGYSSLSIRGTLEIPLTRNLISDRSVATTADAWRESYMNQVVNSIDLTRFKVTRRDFNTSRDKRTMEWDFAAEELPPMPLPPGATSARGEFVVRPKTQGAGLVTWICSLNATYTIRKDQPRRLAWAAFVGLLAFRMQQSQLGSAAAIAQAALNAQQPIPQGNGLPPIQPAPLNAAQTKALLDYWQQQLQNVQQGNPRAALSNAFLVNFGFREGLYEDSKTVSFEASWVLVTVIDLVMLASGLWRGVGISATGAPGKEQRLWAQSIQGISGGSSWLENKLDPAADVIVDLGF